MVVAYAYAAAILVMVMGLNPTAVVRKAGFASLGESTRSAVIVAESSIGDRLGAFQEKALRTLAVWKGHVGGYGRAAVMNAIAFVWRPDVEEEPDPSASRQRRRRGVPARRDRPGRARRRGTFCRAISCVTATTE